MLLFKTFSLATSIYQAYLGRMARNLLQSRLPGLLGKKTLLNRFVLSLIKFPLSFLAFVYISTLSLLHSLQLGVPKVWTTASG